MKIKSNCTFKWWDLRRALMNDNFSMDCKVEDIATKIQRLKTKSF